MQDKTEKVAQLNDKFRKSGNRFNLTYAIASQEDKHNIVKKVMDFDAFNEDNDPHKERDFGSFDHYEKRVFWKIDYYDNRLEFGSEDPSNEAITKRVLTVMFAEEY